MYFPFSLQVLFIALLGLAFGSFGSMLLYRMPLRDTILGRSKCPCCEHTLHAVDLVPILSFLFLRRQCRYCQKVISWRYPFLEGFTALTFVLLVSHFSSMHWIAVLLLGAACYMLILIAFYDFETQKIPDLFVAVLLLSALLYQSVLSMDSSPMLLQNSFAGAAIPFLFFGGLWVMSRGVWIGSGDILLGASIGLLLGVRLMVLTLFLSYVLGAGAVLYLLMTGKVKRGGTIAFGPFLAVSALIALFAGDKISIFV